MSDSKPIKIVLFHMNNCHYCKLFESAWEQMSMDKKAKQYFNFVDYEESKLNNIDKNEFLINGKNIITGFPTIKITIFEKSYVYELAERTPNAIYNFILKKIKKIYKMYIKK